MMKSLRIYLLSISMGVTLVTLSLPAGAVVVKFPVEDTADMKALDTIQDFLLSPWANPKEGPELLRKLQEADNLSPFFVNELLELLGEQRHWEVPVDRKDELLALIPRLAQNSSRFKYFSNNPLRDEIQARVRLLRRFLIRGSGIVLARGKLFIQISRSLGIWDANDMAFYKQTIEQGRGGIIDPDSLATLEQEVSRPSFEVINNTSRPSSSVTSLDKFRQKCQSKLLKPK